MNSKVRHDFLVAECFAAAYNHRYHASYVAQPAELQDDSIDAFLFDTVRRERVGLQLSKVTTEDRMENKGLERLIGRQVESALRSRGVRDCMITVVPGKSPTLTDKNRWRDGIVAWVLRNYNRANPVKSAQWRCPTTFAGLPFCSIHVERGLFDSDLVRVCFAIAKDTPDAAAILQAAISRKVELRYSDSKELWLLLEPEEGAFTIRIQDLESCVLTGTENFAQVWWIFPQRHNATEIFRLGGAGIV